jgi:pimeloyl-ACP methyl ester carboxylesterase
VGSKKGQTGSVAAQRSHCGERAKVAAARIPSYWAGAGLTPHRDLALEDEAVLAHGNHDVLRLEEPASQLRARWRTARSEGTVLSSSGWQSGAHDRRGEDAILSGVAIALVGAVMRIPAVGFLVACSLLSAEAASSDETAIVTGRFYEARGVKLYVETYGSGAPILFLHGGLAFFDNSFGPQREYFSSFRRVVGFDQRGHGHSPDNPAPFSYRQMAEDTAALIELLRIGPVDIVGHSDGANVGLLLALYHPQLVHRLVVSGANLRAGLSDEEQKQSLQELSDALPPKLRADYVKVRPDGAKHWLSAVEKSKQLWMTPVVIEPAELKKLKIPVLVVAGDHDFTSLEETVELFRALPHGQLFIVPATAHDTFTHRPELMNAVIRAFLDEPNSHSGL